MGGGPRTPAALASAAGRVPPGRGAGGAAAPTPVLTSLAMDLDKYIKKAEAVRKRNPPQAIALYKQVLVAQPGNPDARAGLLWTLRRASEMKGGPSLLDKAAATSCRAAAAGLRSQSRWDGVVKTCETGLVRHPMDLGLLGLLAQGLEGAGYPGGALAAWLFRLEIDDADTEALKAAGRLHHALRQIDEAIACLERAHAIDPRDPEIEKMRKNLAAEGTLKATRYESATSSRDVIKDAAGLKKLARDRRLVADGGADAEGLSDDVEELYARWRQAPSLEARRKLVGLLVKMRDHERALEVVEAALEADPREPTLLQQRDELRLARADRQLARAQQAGEPAALEQATAERLRLEVEVYERRAQADPGDLEARLRLGRALFRDQQTDRAIEAFQEALKDPRRQADARIGLGRCFVRKKLYPLARKQLEQALAAVGETSERGKEICYHLGLVCERMDDKPGALERYLQIYEVDINYKDVAQKVETLSAGD